MTPKTISGPPFSLYIDRRATEYIPAHFKYNCYPWNTHMKVWTMRVCITMRSADLLCILKNAHLLKLTRSCSAS